MAVIMMVIAVVIPTGSYLQGFNEIAVPLTSMLSTSSSMDSSTSAIQIAVGYDGIDGGGGKLVKKLSKC